MTTRLLPALLALAALAACTTACTTYRPQDMRAGLTEPEVAALIGTPTGRYLGPNGQTRLEFATGPYGRVTWMVDLDAQGKAIAWAQVLNETAFNYVQLNHVGKQKDWLRYTLGRPGEVMQLGWIGGSVWSYRYPTFDCLWFQITLNDDGTLRDGGSIGTDPRCDAGSHSGWR